MKHEGEWIIEDVHSPIDSWEVEEEGGALLYFKTTSLSPGFRALLNRSSDLGLVFYPAFSSPLKLIACSLESVQKKINRPMKMQLPPLATNTTNTKWWIFPSLLEMVNIPPSTPSRSGSFAGWSDCMFACLVCSLFLSVYLSVYFPPGSVLVFCQNVHITAFNINSHPNLQFSVSNKICMTHETCNLSVESLTENAGQTDRLSVGSLFSACPRHCLHSLSDNYLHIIYMHM